MKGRISFLLLLILIASIGCQEGQQADQIDHALPTPFLWEGANVYFLLTDRFYNGDPNNDLQFGREEETAVLRGFEGGDIAGITAKINEGYFSDLGINALWFTPVVEQDKGLVDEGTGPTYGYHGYWTQDWTALDPNFGTEDELAQLVQAAHSRGIRVLIDVVLNHTGPVTNQDPVWPKDWVRTGPKCQFTTYENTTACTLVENLPDILTESDMPVELPQNLLDKWEAEGRLEQELAELDTFFEETGYPKAPRFYIIKWLTDFIRDYGVDGFRVDTGKHVEETAWAELRKEADRAFTEWKASHPDAKLDDTEFYMVGEVYNYYISDSTMFNFGDTLVNFYEHGLDALINFDFKQDAHKDYESIFSKYSYLLNGPLKGKTVLNYISSHDDSGPFDKERARSIETATKLLLCPGGSQIYYGDESARPLAVEGAAGDANLRANMNWEDITNNTARHGISTAEILSHWQKLGRFRNAHPAVGGGIHQQMSADPYIFSRTYPGPKFEDKVVIGLDLPTGKKTIELGNVFKEGIMLRDYYSGKRVEVKGKSVEIESDFELVLLGIDTD